MATKKINEKKNVQAAAPVMNQVDVMGLMGALNKNGRAKLSDHFIKDEPIEDAQTEEIESVSVGEVSLNDIAPVMMPIEGSEYQVKGDDGKAVTFESVAPNIGYEPAEEAPAVTMPLGQHGTLVIGGVPKREEKPKVTLRKKTTATETSEAKPTISEAKRAYTVVLLPAKSGGVWPKLYGFKSEKDAKAMADKMPSSVTARWDYGQNGEGRETKTKHWYLTGGKRYCGVMQELADALNKGDRVAVANVAAKACGVYAAVVADGKLNEKKGETKAKTEQPKQEPAPTAPAMSDDDLKMFNLFKRFMQNDPEVVAMVNARKAA